MAPGTRRTSRGGSVGKMSPSPPRGKWQIRVSFFPNRTDYDTSCRAPPLQSFLFLTRVLLPVIETYTVVDVVGVVRLCKVYVALSWPPHFSLSSRTRPLAPPCTIMAPCSSCPRPSLGVGERVLFLLVCWAVHSLPCRRNVINCILVRGARSEAKITSGCDRDNVFIVFCGALYYFFLVLIVA